MKLFFLWLLMAAGLAQPPELQHMTVRECLLAFGDSHTLPELQLLDLKGQTLWDEISTEAMQQGELLSGYRVDTDTGERRLILYTHKGQLYLFVFRRADALLVPGDPTQGLAGEHGSCNLWLNYPHEEVTDVSPA